MRKAYEQVADQLRELIVSGQLVRGERLPNETVLAREFGVSRATVREALRLLTAQSLIRTAKGAGGGTYVTMPTVDHVSQFLNSALNLLAAAEHVTLDELLEAREALEVPAARLAAERRTDQAVELLHATIPPDPGELGPTEQFVYNADFHTGVIEASGNVFLMMAAQPLFSILQTQLARSSLGARFHKGINDQHRAIVAAIATRDARRAETEMRLHLEFLRPHYERTWRYAIRVAEQA
ncbi:MAG TPA: FadR/GntR family transcriptional regulator [Gaiellaceae bacterium]|nr:FadR/GntR family transcriptional regulator [Gaiellaceae bacterium]